MAATPSLRARWDAGFIEYEIKVSKSDLIGEVRCARVAWGLDGIHDYVRANKNGLALSSTKLYKHKHYATGEAHTYGGVKRLVPSKFYFAVPNVLADYAVQAVKGLPYGVWCGNSVIKPAKKLEHRNNNTRSLIDMLNRACIERKYIKKAIQLDALNKVPPPSIEGTKKGGGISPS
jgi:hypothetical protein